MRILSLAAAFALAAVFAITTSVSGQGVRQTFSPMPWYPDGKPESLDLDDPDPAFVRLAQAMAKLQGIEPSVLLDRERAASSARVEQRRQQISALAGTGECALPDQTTRPVNTKVTFNGWSYLCVEVLDRQLARQGVAWTRITD